jgi:hypothetical protein
MTHTAINNILGEMQDRLHLQCLSEETMVDTYRFLHDADGTTLAATLVNDGNDNYHAEDVQTESCCDRRHNLLTAEVARLAVFDMYATAQEIEEQRDDKARFTSDPYAYYGVSRSDFV